LVEALAISEHALGKDDPRETETLRLLANTEAALGHAQRAAELFARALAIAETKLGPQNQMTASVLVDRGRATLRAHGSAAAALADGERALTIVDAGLGRDLPSSIDPLTLLGEAELAGRHVAAAIEALERALRIAKTSPAPAVTVSKVQALLLRARRLAA